MTKDQFYSRIKQVNINIIKLAQDLPSDNTGKYLAEKLLDLSERLASDYRMALKSGTKLNFIANLEKPEKSAEDLNFWLESIADSGAMEHELLPQVLEELLIILGMLKETRNFSQKNNEALINKIIIES